MAEPDLVAECVAAMQAETDLPVTIKCRIGIDDMDEEAGLDLFIDALGVAGVRVFYLHARKAWLKGLSPKENRDIPPLNYARARRLAARRPDLMIHLNGGLVDAATIMTELPGFAGVMLGRAAYKTPMLLGELNESIFGRAGKTRLEAAMAMADYADQMGGIPLHAVTRHMLGLYASQRGARYWRRTLGEEARQDRRGGALIRETARVCEEMATSWAA
jgi:tRNA-dihydrouridine synthase A